MNAKIITIGDELLIGQVIDSNSAWIGAELEKINIKVEEIRSISDKHDVIINNLQELNKNSDVILITGGLGPTKDDVTKKALAEFMGVELVFHQGSYDRMVKLLTTMNIPVKEAHRSQAFVPSNCEVIFNKMGTAQGMWMEKDGTIFISMPGVPYEMKYIMENGALEKLSDRNPEGKIYHKTIMTAGAGETIIEEKIKYIVDNLPDYIKVAYLPGLGMVRIRISSFSKNSDRNEIEEISNRIVAALGDIVYGYDDVSLEETIGNLLIKKGLTLGTAESCTGGFLAHMITRIPGSSKYYEGSVISYSNNVKMAHLGVKESTLKNHGAVSEETIREMISGLIKGYGMDVAIATSGIAGPDGGTAEKPVGTIWIAVGDKKNTVTKKLQLTKNRMKNIEYTSIASLNMLRKFLSAQ